eukprot:GILI01003585.1.p1 GENE.GILI01003585.1~~GILI01003585.1.p1  ORF type:complete len:102 (-),score=42.33 GILI01003585.1:65-337(-)
MAATKFDLAAELVRTLSDVSNENLLKLYGLYKQGTVGDNTTSRPGMFDMKGKAKWDAWEAVKGKPQDDAKTEYVALVLTLLPEDKKAQLQ